MKETLEIFIDGACSGNPGQAAIGIVLKKHGQKIQEVSKTIGEATNNIAEYTALIYALQEALVQKAQQIKIYTDSELIYNQVIGQYKVSHEKLKPLFDQVQHLAKGFKHIDIQCIPREENKEADRLAVAALKKKQAKMVAPMFNNSGEESPSSGG